MDLSLYREDSGRQKGGTPIYVGDAVFYVRRWGTPEALKIKREIELDIFGPMHKHSSGDENLLLAHWLVEYGVVKWENVFDENRIELKYSEINARKVILNPEYFLSLNQILFNGAIKFENYLYELSEKDIEDLKKQ